MRSKAVSGYDEAFMVYNVEAPAPNRQ